VLAQEERAQHRPSQPSWNGPQFHLGGHTPRNGGFTPPASAPRQPVQATTSHCPTSGTHLGPRVWAVWPHLLPLGQLCVHLRHAPLRDGLLLVVVEVDAAAVLGACGVRREGVVAGSMCLAWVWPCPRLHTLSYSGCLTQPRSRAKECRSMEPGPTCVIALAVQGGGVRAVEVHVQQLVIRHLGGRVRDLGPGGEAGRFWATLAASSSSSLVLTAV